MGPELESKQSGANRSVEGDRSRGGERSAGDEGDRLERQPAISVTNLEKTYGSGEKAVRAVDDVSFDIEPGTAVGILGPNGAGKTTIIKSILSLIVPTAGNVSVHGTNVYLDPDTAFRRMGAMLEGARNTYWRLTVRENLEIFSVIGGNNYRNRTEEIDDLIEQFGLTAKEDTVVRELSRGQKQKVSLACTMARDADVIFLDEPTLGLDVESSIDLQQELRRLVQEDGSTVVLSSHDMDVIQQVCDRVIIISDGEIIVNDTVDNLLELFESQSYRITVDEVLEDDRQQYLATEYGASAFSPREDSMQFEATVIDDQFYDLIDDLREANLSIESFDSVDVNLEDVFLRVTNDNQVTDPSASEVGQ